MPTPGCEAESLMGHPLSFLRGMHPLKQTNITFCIGVVSWDNSIIDRINGNIKSTETPLSLQSNLKKDLEQRIITGRTRHAKYLWVEQVIGQSLFISRVSVQPLKKIGLLFKQLSDFKSHSDWVQ